jgi:hypothetical protein
MSNENETNVVHADVNSAVEASVESTVAEAVSVAVAPSAVKVVGRPGRPRVPGSNLSRARAEFERNPNRPRAEIIKAFVEGLGIPKPTANTYYQTLSASLKRKA